MANVAENEDTSDDEYDGMDAYEYIDGLDADDYDTDMSQHMGAVSLINTIRKQFEGLTPREVKEAILTRTNQSRIGNPTDKKYKHMISVNSLKECPVRPEHITNAAHAFGPLIAGLEGKTTRRASDRVQVAGTRDIGPRQLSSLTPVCDFNCGCDVRERSIFFDNSFEKNQIVHCGTHTKSHWTCFS